MKNKLYALLPLALLIGACTRVEPAFKDIGTRSAPCVDGGPDQVAQAFYNLRLAQPVQGKPSPAQLAQYRPYLSERLFQVLTADRKAQAKLTALPAGDIFSSKAEGPTSADVSSASRILNTDAKNIPLRVDLSRSQGDDGQAAHWQDEVLMIREGACWVLDDVRYLGRASPAPAGTLRQTLEER
ncbi:lipoprotein [Acerihabitans arboris]|uniref:Lipoprotein n=1 Tax=Acerihabitans arboris TaxID=2691583 RepID=A0A845SDM5_9GAMM|nr:lipoprotein [Acerihabitans arboris]NDL62890.1 lipoprotein [Acerihabitans arboris]